MKAWQALGYVQLAIETALAILGSREKAAQAELRKALQKIDGTIPGKDAPNDDR